MCRKNAPKFMQYAQIKIGRKSIMHINGFRGVKCRISAKERQNTKNRRKYGTYGRKNVQKRKMAFR